MTGSERLDPFELGDWLVRPSRLILERDGESVELEPKAMEVLLVLAERPGESFTRRDLLDRVWPDVVVGDEVLTRAVYVLRKALGDESRDPTYVETIPKIGYRLVAPVRAGERPLPATAGTRPAPRHLRRALVGVGSVAVIGVLVWALILHGASAGDPAPRAFRVTSDPGVEWSAAPSPSGDRIAYSAGTEPDPTDLYVRELDGANVLQLTSDSLWDHSPTWSPDGDSIAFLRTDPDTCRMLLVPALGGPEREITPCDGPAAHPALQHLAWSPDGRWIAWSDGSRRPPRAEIHVVDMASGRAHALDVVDEEGRPLPGTRAQFSPDGTALAFMSYMERGTTLYVVPFRDGETAGPARVVATNVNNVHGLSWGPEGRFLHFSSDRDGMASLYRVDARGGPITRTNLGAEALRPVVVPERGILIYEEWVYDTDIVALSLTGDAPIEPGTPIVDSTQWDTHPSVSPDGRQLAFVSARTGWSELYLADARGGGAPSPLTDLQAQGMSPARWSPDGTRIVFGAQLGEGETGRSGIDLYVIDEIGEPPRLLTTWTGHEISPSWSNDGKWVYFSSERDGSWEIWRIPVAGGTPRRVTADGGFLGREIRDRRLVYTKRGEDGLWVRPLDGPGDESLLVPAFPSRATHWLVRDGAVYRLDREGGGAVRLVATDLSTGSETVLGELPRRTSRTASYDLSLDGTQLYVATFATVESDLRAIPIPDPDRDVGSEVLARLR